MGFRKILEYGNPIPAFRYGINMSTNPRTNQDKQILGLCGVLSGACYAGSTILVLDALRHAGYEEVGRALDAAHAAISGLAIGYALAAATNHHRYRTSSSSQ